VEDFDNKEDPKDPRRINDREAVKHFHIDPFLLEQLNSEKNKMD
jgi:hypothetical protein